MQIFSKRLIDKNDLEQLVQKWNNRLMQHGLRLNLNKTEFLTTDLHLTGTINVNGSDLPRIERFKYPASRINAIWIKWRSTTGVLCDRRINERLKSQIYHNVVRPVTLYGFEYWPTIKDNGQLLAVMETKIALHWNSGVTRFDHIQNEDICDRYGVASKEASWYGHVNRANENSIIEVDGK